MPVLHAPTRPPAQRATDPVTRPLALSTCLGVLAVAVAGLVLTVGLAVLGWLLGDGTGSSAQAVRTGALLWLVGHGGTPTVDGTALTLVPLGIPLVLALLVARAGRWAVGTSAVPGPAGVPAAVGAGTLAYAAAVALAGWAVRLTGDAGGAAVHVDLARGVALTAAVAAPALVVGLTRVPGARSSLGVGVPVELVAVARGAAWGTVVLLGGASLLLVAQLAVRADRVLSLGRALEPGTGGALALALLCVATLPNAVLWTASYLAGPGFAVGTGTVVSTGAVAVGELPAYPLLAGLPAPGSAPAWVSVLLLAPVLAGLVAGVVTARSLTPGGWRRLALTGAGAGASGGLLLAGLMVASGGAVGPSRMQDTGPLALSGVVVVLTLMLASCAGALAHRARTDIARPLDGLRARLHR